MYPVGDVIDAKYSVLDVCSDTGGMGTILHVQPTAASHAYQIVLKYCKATDDASIVRFRREVNYLAGFKGNSLVIQILDANLGLDPPYFVMKYYPEGDLSRLAGKIQADVAFQEVVFNKMLDCIAELHAAGFQHRDVKPQNFLVEGDRIVISDLGLAKEIGAGTTFTESHEVWGTHSYLPPEFAAGGFKAATPPSDIFMLGKTFYSLLTGRDPLYLADTGIHPAVYHVIERCCDMEPQNRYQTVPELRQDLKLAYDVIVGRANGIGKARQILSQILARLNSDRKYELCDVVAFLDLLAMLPDDERSAILEDLPRVFYHVLAQEPVASKLGKFLDQYEPFVEDAVYTWSYAETVANNMRIIFEKSANTKHRARALDIAVMGAVSANRFAAMATCRDMITSVTDDDLGLAVASIIAKHRGSFISGTEPARCHNDAVRNAIRAVQAGSATEA